MKGRFKFLLAVLAKGVLDLLRNNKFKLAAKTARFIFRQGYNIGYRQGKRKGKQLGIEKCKQDIEKCKQDIVKRMLARCMSDDQICDLLQLNIR